MQVHDQFKMHNLCNLDIDVAPSTCSGLLGLLPVGAAETGHIHGQGVDGGLDPGDPRVGVLNEERDGFGEFPDADLSRLVEGHQIGDGHDEERLPVLCEELGVLLEECPDALEAILHFRIRDHA